MNFANKRQPYTSLIFSVIKLLSIARFKCQAIIRTRFFATFSNRGIDRNEKRSNCSRQSAIRFGFCFLHSSRVGDQIVFSLAQVWTV